MKAKRMAAACRPTRHMPGLLERPLATERRAPIESVRSRTRLLWFETSQTTLRRVATMALPSKHVICSFRFQATELTTRHLACRGEVPNPGTRGIRLSRRGFRFERVIGNASVDVVIGPFVVSAVFATVIAMVERVIVRGVHAAVLVLCGHAAAVFINDA